jgi:hypothetical protein
MSTSEALAPTMELLSWFVWAAAALAAVIAIVAIANWKKHDMEEKLTLGERSWWDWDTLVTLWCWIWRKR